MYLPEELDRKFRMLAMSIYGFGRGSLSEAAVQALTDWCKDHETQVSLDLNDKKVSVNSDPATRAEERPGFVGPKEKESSSSGPTKS